ncbi:MAG: hypothetical protein ACRC37_00625, partial [Lentisphaeria bacterium]
MKGKFVGIFVILLGVVLGVFFCGNSSEKIAKNSDCLEFGENPGKNFSENEFFEGRTTEVLPQNAQNRAFEQSETSAVSEVVLKSKFSQNKLHD